MGPTRNRRPRWSFQTRTNFHRRLKRFRRRRPREAVLWQRGRRIAREGYLLDVSTSSSFDSFVDGYHDLDVGNVTGRVVTGLNRGTTYYYRVRAYDATAPSGYSETMPDHD